ncbi:MAG TPA: serine hydrolase domain-containing protein [Stellaceae bacterium]|nr:serine hydrolase domain-containing protein [Stellaceae bacterium]
MRRIGAVALAVVLVPSVAFAAPPAHCGIPAALGDGWAVAAPEREGLAPGLICAIGPRLETLAEADPNGVVIVRHGALVYEHYFTGRDQRWPELQHWREPSRTMPHNANTLHDLQSITKSIVAILVGIALDRGLLKSVDAPVLSFFPQYADLRTPDRDRLTLRNLLSMTSGLIWTSVSTRSVERMDAAPDPYRFVLDQPLEATPGKIWNYNGGGVEVLGAIVKKVSGQPLDRFAKQALFDPLGITDWQWARMPNGAPAASWGLRLRPRDLAKIGQLVLNRGLWHGRRVVSAAWIREMTAAHSPSGWLSAIADAYGYLWWRGHASLDNRNIAWVGGIGHGGQRLYVVPSRDLVVAVTAGNYKFFGAEDPAGDTALDRALRAAMPGEGR